MSFSRISSIALNAGETNIGSGVIDTVNNILYYYTSQSPAKVIQVNLSNFTQGNTVTFNAGENNSFGERIILDINNGFGYVGLYSPNPSIVVKIGLDGIFGELPSATKIKTGKALTRAFRGRGVSLTQGAFS